MAHGIRRSIAGPKNDWKKYFAAGAERAELALAAGSFTYDGLGYTVYNKQWGYWLGKNGKFYQGLSGRGPNGFTGSRASAFKASRVYGLAGRIFGIAGVTWSGVKSYQSYTSGNYEGAFINGFDTVMGGIGVWGGPYGWAVSGTYFLTSWATDNGYIRSSEYKRDWSRTCFIAGTKILMADGTQKNIEDIRENDLILSVNMNTMKIEGDKVVLIPDTKESYNQILFRFGDGTETISSPHHPFYVKDKGWCVYDVEMARKDLNFQVHQINENDIVFRYKNGKLTELEITGITNLNKKAEMYNLKYVEKNNTFFANGILVHNRYMN